MSGTQIRAQIWHPTQGQVLVPQNNFWGPFLGSIFGAQFWGPVFGSSFGTQFWIRSGTKKSQFSVSVFGTKSGSIFGVQILVLLILLIGAGFQVPVFGTKNGPSSGTQKIKKLDQIWHSTVGPDLVLQTQILIWRPNKGPALASKKGSISGTQIRDHIWPQVMLFLKLLVSCCDRIRFMIDALVTLPLN